MTELGDRIAEYAKILRGLHMTKLDYCERFENKNGDNGRINLCIYLLWRETGKNMNMIN